MNAIAIRTRLPMPPEAGASGITPQQWRVLTEAIFPAAKTAEAVSMAIDYCRARGLDVFKRPVHIVPVWNSALRREVETIWPGVNELQVTAARTGVWAGMDEPKWGKEITRTFRGKDGDVTVTYPESCSVTVYRLVSGQRSAFAEPVYWEEAYARSGRSDAPNSMWCKRPRGQLHKVAKAASLRAAFPEEIGSDYSAEEMQGQHVEAGGIVIDAKAEPDASASAAPEPAERSDDGSWLDTHLQALEAEKDGTKWLVLLDKALGSAPDTAAIDALLESHHVRVALGQAPARVVRDIQKAADAARERLKHPPAEFSFPITDEFGEIVSDPIGSPDRFAHALLDHWRKTADKALAAELLHNNADAIAALPTDVRATLDEIEAPTQGMEV